MSTIDRDRYAPSVFESPVAAQHSSNTESPSPSRMTSMRRHIDANTTSTSQLQLSNDTPMELVHTRPLAEVTLGGTFVAPDTIVAAVPGSDGQYVWTVEMNGWIRQRNPVTGAVEHQQRLKTNQEPTALAVCGGKVWVGLSEGMIAVYRESDRKHVADCALHEGSISALSQSDDDILSGGVDGRIALWSGSDATCKSCHRLNEDEPVNCLCYVPGLGVFSNDGTSVSSFEPLSWELRRSFVGHSAPVLTVTVTGGVLWSGSEDNTVRTWNVATGVCQRTIELHTAPVHSIVHVRGENKLWTCGMDGKVAFWDAHTCDLIGQLPLSFPKGKQHFVFTLAPISQATIWRLWSCGTDGCVNSWLSQSTFQGGEERLLVEIDKLRGDLADMRRQNETLSNRVPHTQAELSEFLNKKRAEHNQTIADLETHIESLRRQGTSEVEALREELNSTRMLGEEEHGWRLVVAHQAFIESADLCSRFHKVLSAEIEQKKKEAADATALVAERDNNLASLQEAQSELLQEVSRLKDDLTEACSLADESQRKSIADVALVLQLEDDVKEAQSTLRSRDETILAQRERIQSLLDNQDADAAASTSRISELEQQLAAQRSALSKLQDEMTSVHHRHEEEAKKLNEDHKAVVFALEDKVLLAESSLDRHLATIDTLEAHNQDLSAETMNVKVELQSSAETFSVVKLELEAELEEMKSLLMDATDKKESLTKELQIQMELASEASQLSMMVESLRRELRLRNEELDLVHNKNDELKSRVDEVVRDYEASRVNLSTMEADKMELSVRLSEDVDEAKKRVEALKTTVENLHNEKATLQNQVEMANEELNLLRVKAQKFESASTSSEKTIESLRNRLQVEEDAVTRLETLVSQRDADVSKANVAISTLRSELTISQDAHIVERSELEHQLERMLKECNRFKKTQEASRNDQNKVLSLQEELHKMSLENKASKMEVQQLKLEREQLATNLDEKNELAMNAEVQANEERLKHADAMRSFELESGQKIQSLSGQISRLRHQLDEEETKSRKTAKSELQLLECQNSLQRISNELQDCRNEASRTETLLSDSNRNLKLSNDRCEDLANQLEGANSTLAQIRSNAAIDEQKNSKRVLALQKQLEDANAQNEGLKEATVSLMKEVKLKTTEAERLTEEVMEVSSQAQQRLDRAVEAQAHEAKLLAEASTQRCQRLADEVEAARQEASQLREKNQTLEAKLATTQQRLTLCEAELRDAHVAAEFKDTSYTELLNTTRELKEELNSAALVKEAADESQQDVYELVEVSNSAVKLLREASTGRQHAEDTLHELQDEVSKLNVENRKLTSEVDILKSEIHSYEKLLEETVATNKTQHESIKQSASQERAANVDVRERLSTVLQEKEEAEEAIKLLNEKYQKRLHEMELKLSTTTTEMDIAKSSLSQLRAERTNEASNKAIEDDKKRLVLEKELAAATARAEEASHEVSRLSLVLSTATSSHAFAVTSSYNSLLTVLEDSEGSMRSSVLENQATEMLLLRTQFGEGVAVAEARESERSLEELAEEYVALKAHQEELEARLSSAQHDATETSQVMEDQNATVIETMATVQKLQHENMVLSQKLESASKEVKSLQENAQAARYEAEQQSLENERQSLEFQQLQGTLRQLELKDAEDSHETDSLRNKVKESDKQIVQLRGSVEHLENQLRDAQKLRLKNAALERDTENQRRIIRSLEKEVSDMSRRTRSVELLEVTKQ